LAGSAHYGCPWWLHLYKQNNTIANLRLGLSLTYNREIAIVKPSATKNTQNPNNTATTACFTNTNWKN
jgi:hypothetical protein